MRSKPWSREELILAFNLYCKTPFGRIHNRNDDIIQLAKVLDRSPSAVSWKLANFARFDPALKARQIKGAGHGSKLEEEIWKAFNSNWDEMIYESEQKLASIMPNKEAERDQELLLEVDRIGLDRESMVRVRVNQNFFRMAVLAAYDFKCCITGLEITELLNASHIVPWTNDKKERLNPRNGLCLNVLHDRAFDRGLITIDSVYRVVLAKRISTHTDEASFVFLHKYAGRSLRLPNRFLPEQSFVEYHRRNIFKG